MNTEIDSAGMDLLASQQEIVYGQLAMPEGAPSPYWMGDYFELENLNIDRLIQAVTEVAPHTPATRTRFRYEGGEVRQYFLAGTRPDVHVVDFSHERDPLAASLQSMADALTAPCALLDMPLMDFTVYKLDANRVLLFERGHHSILDAYGGGLHISAISLAYNRTDWLGHGLTGPSELADEEQNHSLASRPDWAVMTPGHILPWFRGDEVVPPTALPRRASRIITRATAERLKGLADAWGVKFESLYIAAVAEALGNLMAPMKDFAVLIPTHGRSRNTRTSIGMAANMVPLVVSSRQRDYAIREFVQDCDSGLRQALGGRHHRIEQYRKTLDRRVSDRLYTLPIINIISYYQELTFGECSAPPTSLSAGAAHGIEISVMESNRDAGVDLHIDCNADVFEVGDSSAIAAELLDVLDMYTGMRGDAVLPHINSEQNIVRSQLIVNPQALAIRCAEGSLTYTQLCAAAAELARRLAGEGIGSGSRVVVAAPHGPIFPIAALALSQIGAIYVPIQLPIGKERLNLVLDAASPAAIIGERDLDTEDLATPVFSVEPILPVSAEASVDGAYVSAMLGRLHRLSYMIFTSGSTGTPKGVLVEEHATLALIEPTLELIGARPEMVWLAQHTFGFDFSVWEMLGALLSSGTLVLPGDEVRRNVEALADTIERYSVDVLNITPDAFNALDDSIVERVARRCARIVFGGARLVMRRKAAELLIAEQVRTFNMYGITECAVHATAYEVTYRDIYPGSKQRMPVPIGGSLPSVDALVLGDDLMSVGAGGVGELYLVGPQLASGYFGRVALTAERFVPCPLVPGEVMFRTGDLVRVGTDGGFSYVGRSDFQLNVRGHRVEPGEIECAATALDGVENCVVLERSLEQSTGSLSLVVAFVTESVSSAVDPDEVRAALGSRLPDYMVPNRVVVVGAIPLTASGKVDRPALAKIPLNQGLSDLSGSDLERAVCDVFSEVLQCGQVGRSDDFFELGGHSLAALKVSRLLQDRGWKVSPATVLRNPQPRAIALFLTVVADEQMDTALRAAPQAVAGESALNVYNSTLAVMLGGSQGRLKYQIPLLVCWTDVEERTAAMSNLRSLSEAAGCEILKQRYVFGAGRNNAIQRGPVQTSRWHPKTPDAEQTVRDICRAAAAKNDVPALEVYTFDDVPNRRYSALLIFSHLFFDDMSVRWVFSHVVAESNGSDSNLSDLRLSYCAFSPPPPISEFVVSEYAGRLNQCMLSSDFALVELAPITANDQSSRSIRRHISATSGRAIAQAARLRNSTAFVLLNIAIRLAVASRHSSMSFPIGTAVSLRDTDAITPDTRTNIGYALNTVLLPQSLEEDKTVSELFASTHRAVADSIEFSEIPYASVATYLYQSGSYTSSSTIEVWAQLIEPWQYDHGSRIIHAGLVDNGAPKFGLTFFLEISGGVPIRLIVQYDSARFSTVAAEALAESTVHYLQLLAECKPSTLIAELIGAE
ncbi:non-ribosomal peptide synthetase [Rhodococcus qingshengii]|uniref:non-ribosomal peptide synthetase n=1 Tax=Rhodococcus qingshengii TaxID=334542 RepID=UPI0035FE46BE